jgi:hypothetical protein
VTGLVCAGDAVRALAVGSTLHARELLDIAVTEGVGLAVPAAAYAAAWARSTPTARMWLDDFLELSVVTVDPLDATTARAVGVVLARSSGGAELDVGQVVVSARARGWPVLAVHPGPLLATAPDLAVEALP